MKDRGKTVQTSARRGVSAHNHCVQHVCVCVCVSVSNGWSLSALAELRMDRSAHQTALAEGFI